MNRHAHSDAQEAQTPAGGDLRLRYLNIVTAGFSSRQLHRPSQSSKRAGTRVSLQPRWRHPFLISQISDNGANQLADLLPIPGSQGASPFEKQPDREPLVNVREASGEIRND